jgi:O-antigen ligase
MLSQIDAYARRRGLDIAIVAVFGLIASLTIFNVSLMPLKWMVFIIFGICAISLMIIIPQREKFILYLSVLLMSVYLDFHPYYIDSEIAEWPVAGFRISIFDVAFFCLMVAWMFRLLTERDTPFRWYPNITIPFLLLWLLALASNSLADMPIAIKASTLWMVLESWLIFLYFANNVRDRHMLGGIIAALLISGLLQAMLGISQYLAGSSLGLGIFGESKTFMAMRAGEGLVSRVAGTFGHPNNLAGYLNMLVMINLALLFADIDLRWKFLLLPTLGLIVIADLLTLSRGAWLAMGFGFLVTLSLCLGRRWHNKFLSFLVAAMILFFFLITSLTFVEPLNRRFFQEDYGSAQSRVPMILVALNIIQHNTWLGVGLTNYVSAAPAYDTTRGAISYEFPRPVHNEFLLIAAELGVPVLLLFVTILLTIMVQLWRLSNYQGEGIIPFLAIGLFGTYLGWIIFRQTDYSYVLLADSFWVLAGLTQSMTTMVGQDRGS